MNFTRRSMLQSAACGFGFLALEALRRHPTRMALRWGLPFLIKFKLGLLSLDYCERFFSEFLKAPCRGMISRHSALAMDLDRPEDVPLLERALRSRGAC